MRGYGSVRSQEVCIEAQEGRSCTEVHAIWHSGAAQNQREKRKKGGAIEGRRRYIVGERIETILELFFKAFFSKKYSKDVS